MANPIKYTPAYSFSGFQASNPTKPLPAPRIDDELANVARTTTETIDALAQIRRSDGKLANAVVDLAALSDEVIRELGSAGAGSGGDGVIFATEAQATAGTSAAVVMSPLRVRQAIATFASDGGDSTTPGGPIDIDDVTGLSDALAGKSNTGHTHAMSAVSGLADALAGKQAALGYTPEDRTNRGQAGGYASLGSDGKVPTAQLPAAGSGSTDAAQIMFRPLSAPSLAIPVSERLGAEVFLTDGYKTGDQLADFTDLFQANMQRAITEKRPFIVPAGEFRLTRKLAFTDASVFMHGAGKRQSVLVWDGGEDSGLDFTSSANYYNPDHMHFSDFALATKAKAVGRALRCSWEPTLNRVFNPSDPQIFDRYSHRFLVRDVVVRGASYVTTDGWFRGIDVLYPIDAYFERCHVAGYQTAASDTGMQTQSGLYAGVPNGVGHPTGVFFNQCFVQSVQTALEAEGCEGLVASECQLVGINNGIRFTDPLGRPLLMATNNHINAFVANIIANAASQIQVIGNSLYHTIGSSTDGTGVSIGGPSQHAVIMGNVFESAIGSDRKFRSIVVYQCDHGMIDGNTFRTGVVSPNPANMYGITLGSNARFFKVGNNNVFEDPQSGRPALISTIEDGGTENKLPAMGARYTKSGGQYASGETVISFDLSESVVGGVESVADGGFTCRVPGLWHFTFGVVAQATSGGQVLAIKKNGLGTTALVSDSKDYQGSTPISMHVTTGPVLMNKGDTVYPVFNTPGTTVNVHPATFFEARRLS